MKYFNKTSFSFLLLTVISFSIFAQNKLRLIENKGQWDKHVQYKMKLDIGDMYWENNRLTYSFWEVADWEEDHDEHAEEHAHKHPKNIRGHAYYVNFVGANANPTLVPSGKYAEYHNYYLDNDPKKWASNVPIFEEVLYEKLYNGIDMHFYAHEGFMKYDFLVAKGANPALIRLKYEGVKSVVLEEGNILVSTSINQVKELKPVAYQVINGVKKEVSCKYVLQGKEVSFAFPNGYDTNVELVIDPTMIFSTPTGSTAGNWGYSATYDLQGNAYGGGIVFSAGYPTTAGAFQTTFQGSTDAGITKFDPTGATAIFSTYLGGSAGFDSPNSMIVDYAGNLVVMGVTVANNFPTSVGAYDVTHNGEDDFYVAKFSPTGTYLGGTFVGGSLDDGRNNSLSSNYGDPARGEVVIDALNNIYVTGCSSSNNFPVTAGAYDASYNGLQDAVVFKLDANLSTLIWATYLGGTSNDGGFGIKVDNTYQVYVCGGSQNAGFPITAGAYQTAFGGIVDAYIAKFDASGSNLLAATFLGTSVDDRAYFIEVNSANEVYVTGQSDGNFLVQNVAYSLPNGKEFITKLDSNLATVIFSTVICPNTSTLMSPTAFLVDVCDNLYICGWGSTTGFPVTPGAVQGTTDGSDFYLAVLEPNAAGLLYGTFWGGSSGEHVDGGTSRFDKNGIVYEAVCANGSFPITPGAFSSSINSSYNLSVFKIDFGYAGVTADFQATNSGAIPIDTICMGDTVYFPNSSTGTIYTTYFWDFGDGVTATDSTPSHVYGTFGTFNVMLIATDTSTCNGVDTAYRQVLILENSTPSFTMPASVCTGEEVTITYTGDLASNYVWDFDGGSATPGIGIGPHQVTWNTPGVKNVIIQIQGSCSGIGSSNIITVNELPTADFTATSPICQTDSATLTYTGTGTAGATYQWNFGGGNANTGVGQGPHSVNWAASGTQQVILTVTENGCVSLPDTQNVVVNAIPNVSFNLQDSVCINATAVLSVINPIAGATYNWNFGTATGGGVGAGPFNLAWNGTGIFNVSVDITVNGCTSPLFTKSIEVFDIPTSTFTTNSPVCFGTQIAATYTGTGTNNGNYTWNFGAGTVIAGSGMGPYDLSYPVGNGSISLVVSENGCTSPITTQAIIVNPIPVSTFDMPLTTCGTNPVTITYTGTQIPGATYNWNFDGGTASGTGAGPYNVSWNSAGIYNVTLSVSANGCNSTISTNQIEVYQIPTTSFTTNTPVCEGQKITAIYAGNASGAAQYDWDFGVGEVISGTGAGGYVLSYAPGNYPISLQVTENGCPGVPTTFAVTVNPNPVIDAGQNQRLCEGDSITLLASSSEQDLSYLWTAANAFLQTPNNIQTLCVPVPPDAQMAYLLATNNTTGCFSRDSLFISFNPFPAPAMLVPDSVCLGESPIYYAFSTERVEWFSDMTSTTPIYFGTSVQLATSVILPTLYVETVTNLGCRGGRYPITAYLFPEQSGTIENTPDVLETPNATTTFSVNFSSGVNLYTWSFDDSGNGSYMAEPTYQYAYPGKYNVKVDLTDENGCPYTLNKLVEVKEVKGVFVPTVFTPNNDNSNDMFFVGSYHIDYLHFEIYSRWGQLIYASDNPAFTWDGKYKNDPCPEGVYVWKYKCRYLNGQEETKSGTVTLVR